MNERKTMMDERAADKIASVLGGTGYLTDENEWVVILNRSDGRVVIISDMSVDEYPDWEACKAGHCYASIKIC